MPIPVSLDVTTNVITPKVIIRTQSFTTMSNFISINDLSFDIGPHHSSLLVNVDHNLNNVYSKQLDDPALLALFAETERTAFKDDCVNIL